MFESMPSNVPYVLLCAGVRPVQGAGDIAYMQTPRGEYRSSVALTAITLGRPSELYISGGCTLPGAPSEAYVAGLYVNAHTPERSKNKVPVVLEERSKNTATNWLFTRELMLDRGSDANKIAVITDEVHMKRALLIGAKVMGKKTELIPVPSMHYAGSDELLAEYFARFLSPLVLVGAGSTRVMQNRQRKYLAGKDAVTKIRKIVKE